MTQADRVHSTPPTNTSANTPTIPQGSSQSDVYLPADISPDTLFRAWSRQHREALIEMLIEGLDAADGDTDLEPVGDELDASYPESSTESWSSPERPHEDDETTMDDEPSLGSVSSNGGSQAHWAAGGSNDREEDNDSGVADLDGVHEQNLVSRHYQQVV